VRTIQTVKKSKDAIPRGRRDDDRRETLPASKCLNHIGGGPFPRSSLQPFEVLKVIERDLHEPE